MQVISLSADFGVHFNTILYPFSIIEMTGSLEKIGYDISPDIPFPRPIGRFIGSGAIGRKGKISIQMDSGAQLLAAVGGSLSSAFTEFNEVNKALAEDHKIDTNAMVKFYRLTANYEVVATNNVIQKIANNVKVPALEQFIGILKQNVIPVELKLGSKDFSPNSENWFDITIRPNYERCDRFLVSIIYRSTKFQEIQDFVTHAEENLAKLIGIVEG